MSDVFIALQTNEESRYIVEALLQDNPGAVVDEQPAMVKINVPGSLVLRRETMEEVTGRPYDLQEMQIHLITLSGHVDEDEDEFRLAWNT